MKTDKQGFKLSPSFSSAVTKVSGKKEISSRKPELARLN